MPWDNRKHKAKCTNKEMWKALRYRRRRTDPDTNEVRMEPNSSLLKHAQNRRFTECLSYAPLATYHSIWKVCVCVCSCTKCAFYITLLENNSNCVKWPGEGDHTTRPVREEVNPDWWLLSRALSLHEILLFVYSLGMALLILSVCSRFGWTRSISICVRGCTMRRSCKTASVLSWSNMSESDKERNSLTVNSTY